MDLYFTTKQIPRMGITPRPWQILTVLHWLLVVQTRRLKYWIFQETPGPKLPIILIMNSEFSIFIKLNSIVRTFLNYFSINSYATVTTSKGALFIGGYGDGAVVATVACYNNVGWSRLDDLQSIRRNHRAIINGDKVYVIGGGSGTK